MKKAIAILLVLLVAGVVFGADASLSLQAAVNLRQKVLISAAGDITNKGEFDTANTGTPEVFSLGSFEADDSGSFATSFYLYLLTNKKAATSIELKGTPLVLTGGVETDQAIGYTITTTNGTNYTASAALVVADDDATEIASASYTTVGEFASGTGMRVEKAASAIALTEADLLLANAGDYTGTVVVNIVSGT